MKILYSEDLLLLIAHSVSIHLLLAFCAPAAGTRSIYFMGLPYFLHWSATSNRYRIDLCRHTAPIVIQAVYYDLDGTEQSKESSVCFGFIGAGVAIAVTDSSVFGCHSQINFTQQTQQPGECCA
jgi:hypothetical protein